MGEIIRYQQNTQFPARQVRRELARNRDRMKYISEVTHRVQQELGCIQTEGTRLMVEAAIESHALIKDAESQGVNTAVLEMLIDRQMQAMLLMSQTAQIGSEKLLGLIGQLPSLPRQSFLDWLNGFINNYYE